MDKLLAEVKDFKQNGSLKQTETQITTPSGEKFTEKRDPTGTTYLESKGERGYGFCPEPIDLPSDLTVGVAMPRLLVGSQDLAHDLAELKRHGVTHILNVAYGIANLYTDELEYLTVEMFDDLEQNLLSAFVLCQDFIDKGREAGTVFIHCNAGRSRSTSMALAYVMHREKTLLDEALERLRETRKCVQPNESFMKQLRTMEANLELTKR